MLALWWGLLPPAPVTKLQHGVNLSLARQTGFVLWEELKAGFQWQSSGEVMVIG